MWSCAQSDGWWWRDFEKVICCGHELTEEDVVSSIGSGRGRKKGKLLVGMTIDEKKNHPDSCGFRVMDHGWGGWVQGNCMLWSFCHSQCHAGSQFWTSGFNGILSVYARRQCLIEGLAIAWMDTRINKTVGSDGCNGSIGGAILPPASVFCFWACSCLPSRGWNLPKRYTPSFGQPRFRYSMISYSSLYCWSFFEPSWGSSNQIGSVSNHSSMVGIIASVRRILTAGAELSHLHDIPEETFRHYLMDLGLQS